MSVKFDQRSGFDQCGQKSQHFLVHETTTIGLIWVTCGINQAIQPTVIRRFLYSKKTNLLPATLDARLEFVSNMPVVV